MGSCQEAACAISPPSHDFFQDQVFPWQNNTQEADTSFGERHRRGSEDNAEVRSDVGFPGGATVRNLPADAGDAGSVP